MGLSKEERLERTFYTLNAFRKHLENNWADYRLEANLVKAIENSSRQLTGIVLAQFDSNSAYWFTGQMGGFQDQHIAYFYAERSEDHWLKDTLNNYTSLELSKRDFANRLGFNNDVINLARWWDLYEYVPALLYSINRYDDDLYRPEFKQEFNRMLSYIADLKPHAEEQHEKILLLKYSYFFDEAIDVQDNDYKKINELLDKYRNMTQQELENIIKEDQKKKFSHKPTQPTNKVNPICGASPTEDASKLNDTEKN